MTDKLAEYRRPQGPLPAENTLWPLYGAGLQNLGKEGQVIQVPLPEVGPEELLVRHDAVGICFSDIKVIRAGEEHPRIFRDMKADPVVLGHEVSMTVVAVGENLRQQYKVGDRFIVQADIFLDGVTSAYGYEIQGGLSHYNLIDWRVLNGDHGNYLLPLQDETGYAESALTEPWACVIAAYQLEYRTALKPGGTTWLIGTGADPDLDYSISQGFDEASHPDRLILTQVPPAMADWLQARAEDLGIEVLEAPPGAEPSVQPVDDIILLAPDPDAIERVSPFLADFGVLALLADQPLSRKANVDVGRVHYNRWLYVGASGPDLAAAYNRVPVRSTLKPGGTAWFLGAGGPMGRMHVQRAIEISNGPATILCTDVSDYRLADLQASFAAEAQRKGIDFLCLNPLNSETYQAELARFGASGFDDIIMLAPVPPAIEEAAEYLAPRGVMNVFAGLARGTMASLDLSGAYLNDTRVIGHSASTIEDLRVMLDRAESGSLSPNRSVAAVGSLSAARAGLQAVQDALYPGKVVIYPHIKDFPLTPLPELKDALPTVYAKLKDGREWTVEAETEFLRLLLA